MRNWGIIGLVILLFSASLLTGTTTVKAAEPSIEVDAETAILINYDTGKILYEKKADQPMSPASMTKMMTEYLVLEAIKKGEFSWDTKVTVSDYAYTVSRDPNLSNVLLLKDVKYTVEELYKAMVIESANGATIALAELVAGSEKKFVQMMNQKAKELGLKTYKFVNSTGLNNRNLFGMHPAGGPNEENMMSARATAKLAYHLIKDQPEALKYTSMKKAEFKTGYPEDNPLEMTNWNWMLPGFNFSYKGIDGLKTGTTAKAGYCFTATAKRDGTRLISVVMNTDSYAERFGETRKLLDYGFNRFEKVTLVEKGYTFKKKETLPVTKGKEDSVDIAVKEDLSVLVRKGTKDKYKPVLNIDKSNLTDAGELTAPVKKGYKVGTVTVKAPKGNGYGYITEKTQNQLTVDMVTTEKVEKASWFTLALRGIGDFFAGIWNSAAETVKGWF